MVQIIHTKNLKKNDVPLRLKLSNFSVFALSFDPVDECAEGLGNERVLPKNTPSKNDSIIALRLFIYEWQRIRNNSGYIDPNDEKKIILALNILREKLPG